MYMDARGSQEAGCRPRLLVHALLREQRGTVPADLREPLFERVIYANNLAQHEQTRYRDAKAYAARLCAAL